MSRTRQSLISTKILNPTVELANKIGLIKRQVARIMGMPVSSIYQVRLRKHQLWISYKGKDGRCCSRFFSYRALPVWQKLINQAISKTKDLPAYYKLAGILKSEFKRYPYSNAAITAIQSVLDTHFASLTCFTTIAP